jgi:hypothetical protein
VASRFRLEDLLEDHSGARFWRATDLTLARNVAIHVIPADDPRAAAVLTAARTSATVSDGHILRVLDALQEEDVVHVVHEWGSGISLDRLLAEDTLEPRRAAWLVREVAEAIAVAHRHGIAHGRLLPENVLLTDTGSVKLIGFVVDAVLHGRPQRVGDEGEPPSEHESDVVNLGALLYACLTAKWPGFPESVVPDAPLDHGRVCRPRQVRPRVPKRLDVLCDQIINAAPRTDGRRLESAVAISSALGDYLGDTLTGATLAVSGPTAFLDPGSAPAGRTGSDPGAPEGEDDASALAADPEATQAGLPQIDTDPTADPVSEPVREPGGDHRAERTTTVAVSPATRLFAAGPDPRTGTGSGPTTGPTTGTRTDTGTGTGPGVGPGGPGGRGTAGRSGAGAVPAHWGPDRPDDTGSWAAQPGSVRPGSSWLRLAVVLGVLLLLLLAVVFAFSLGRDRSADDDPTTPPTPSADTAVAEPVDVAAISAFDPDGGGALNDENVDQVPLAVDGDPATAWETSTYFDGPVLAPFKSGVGLLVDVGSETEIADVTVTLGGGPYDLQLLAVPPGSAAPTSVDGLQTVETVSGASGEVELAGDEAVTARYVVVWLTALPEVSGGFKGTVAEVVVRS